MGSIVIMELDEVDTADDEDSEELEDYVADRIDSENELLAKSAELSTVHQMGDAVPDTVVGSFISPVSESTKKLLPFWLQHEEPTSPQQKTLSPQSTSKIPVSSVPIADVNREHWSESKETYEGTFVNSHSNLYLHSIAVSCVHYRRSTIDCFRIYRLGNNNCLSYFHTIQARRGVYTISTV